MSNIPKLSYFWLNTLILGEILIVYEIFRENYAFSSHQDPFKGNFILLLFALSFFLFECICFFYKIFLF